MFLPETSQRWRTVRFCQSCIFHPKSSSCSAGRGEVSTPPPLLALAPPDQPIHCSSHITRRSIFHSCLCLTSWPSLFILTQSASSSARVLVPGPSYFSGPSRWYLVPWELWLIYHHAAWGSRPGQGSLWHRGEQALGDKPRIMQGVCG